MSEITVNPEPVNPEPGITEIDPDRVPAILEALDRSDYETCELDIKLIMYVKKGEAAIDRNYHAVIHALGKSFEAGFNAGFGQRNEDGELVSLAIEASVSPKVEGFAIDGQPLESDQTDQTDKTDETKPSEHFVPA
jgi:hypothetical protein